MSQQKERISTLKQLLEKRRETLKAFSEVIDFLGRKGVEKAIAEEIVLSLQKESKVIHRERLVEELAKKVRTTGGILEEAGSRVMVLVGPTGVGKTTTLLKLANRYGFQQKKKVALVSLDEEKAGAFQQLENVASYWKIPLYEGIKSISTLTDRDLILIDTTGCNFYHTQQVDRLASMIHQLGPEASVHLTLSAATKDVDIYGAIHCFSFLPLSSLIFTKLDETLAAGVLVNVCQHIDLPLSYVTYGYPLPGEIQVADAKEIANRILVDFTERESHLLKQISIIQDQKNCHINF